MSRSWQKQDAEGGEIRKFRRKAFEWIAFEPQLGQRDTPADSAVALGQGAELIVLPPIISHRVARPISFRKGV